MFQFHSHTNMFLLVCACQHVPISFCVGMCWIETIYMDDGVYVLNWEYLQYMMECHFSPTPIPACPDCCMRATHISSWMFVCIYLYMIYVFMYMCMHVVMCLRPMYVIVCVCRYACQWFFVSLNVYLLHLRMYLYVSTYVCVCIYLCVLVCWKSHRGGW